MSGKTSTGPRASRRPGTAGRCSLSRETWDARRRASDRPRRASRQGLPGAHLDLPARLRSEFPPLKTISNTNLPRPASAFVGREREVEEVTRAPGGRGAAPDAERARAGRARPGLRSRLPPGSCRSSRKRGLLGRDGGASSPRRWSSRRSRRRWAPRTSLAAHIGDREILLLLDNLEQVVDAAPRARPARSRPARTSRLLVTSRELLRVSR